MLAQAEEAHMLKGRQAITLFAFLFEQGPPVMIDLWRANSHEVTPVDIDNPDTIPFDERDQRTLIMFDGDIPWQGLPKGSDIVYQESLDPLELSPHHMRPERPGEERRPPSIRVTGKGLVLQMQRTVVLSPVGTLLFRRYKKNGTASYCLIEIRRDGEYSVVESRSSSY